MPDSTYTDFQAEDTTDTRTAVKNQLREKARKQREFETLDVEGLVRNLLKESEQAIAAPGQADRPAEHVLEELHWLLWSDPERPALVHGTLDSADDASPGARVQFQQFTRLLEAGQYPNATAWQAVLAEVAKGLDIAGAYSDLSQYVPVRMEQLDWHRTPDDASVDEADVPPIGLVRVPRDSVVPLSEREVELPHESCPHILAVAAPREGKDSTLASIGGHLKDHHGYKWVSVHDDGRNELPMIAIPSDDPGVNQSLDRMGQSPKAYPTSVYVPAMPGLPDRLPANHELFTIGIDDLTPELILRLAGITGINANTERRLHQALQETLQEDGAVDTLVNRIEAFAGEMEATIEVTELVDGDEDVDEDEVEKAVKKISYEMDEDAAMREAGHAIGQLAGDGLLADAGTSTNLDMRSVLEDQETVAVLNCNFLPAGLQSLKYIIIDLWYQLIRETRDTVKGLARVFISAREYKNLAPSKLQDAKYSKAINSLRQTIYELATQGGSRGILLGGSTQKYNDVYKPVRQNHDIHVLLRNRQEQVSTLNNAHDFKNWDTNSDPIEQLTNFDTGQGMVITPQDQHWPIQWRGARCGLGDKDRDWLDRYGLAWGARVLERRYQQWRAEYDAPPFWVEVNDREVRPPDEPPSIGDYYSNWYLLPQDFPGINSRDDAHRVLAEIENTVDDASVSGDSGRYPTIPEAVPVDERPDVYEPDGIAQLLDIEAALADRRDYPIPNDLSLKPVDVGGDQRTETYRDLKEAREEKRERLLNEADVPAPARGWFELQDKKRAKFLTILETLHERPLQSYTEIEQETGVSRASISDYLTTSGELAECVVDDEDAGYTLTPVGERALATDWTRLSEKLDEI